MTEQLILILVSIGMISLFCQWIAWRVKLPAILFLIICGLLLGPTLHWLQPQIVFGDLLSPLIALSVAVILFEGSLTLNFSEVNKVAKTVRNLISGGVIITWLLVTLFTHWIFHMPWPVAFLFGAILTISGPTVILPMLNAVRPKTDIMNIMRWEGILIDPIGALLAVLVFTYISQAQANIASTVLEIIEVLLIGGLSGAFAGWLLGTIFSKYWIPEYLHNIATLVFVSTAFAITNHIEDGAGLLTVTIMGIWLANMKHVNIEGILNFKASLSILLISALFILLAADITFEALGRVLLPSFLLYLAIQFIVRPISVGLCTFRSKLSLQEKCLISWISPRGIVCAAMAAIFSMQLTDISQQQAQSFILVTFLIIMFTVIIQSLVASPLAKLLKVSNPEPIGYLIIGANPVAQCIAKALIANDFQATLVANNWQAISEARMQGIPVFYGNPASEYADRHLDLVGLGNVLALSPRKELNNLSCIRYSKEFGKNHAFMLTASETSATPEKVYAHISYRPHLLFGKDVTYAKLASMIANGAQTKNTKLTDSFTLDDFIASNPANTTPLFLINNKGKLRFFLVDEIPSSEPGDTLVSLSPAAPAS